ncbi:MAG: hypothetical protein WD077_02645 [Bacteroidia bacterium]
MKKINKPGRWVYQLDFSEVYALSCTIMLLVIVFRFNKTGVFYLFEYFENDSAYYEAMVSYFRSGKIFERLSDPFVYRPLLPFLASLLPFDPLTAINLMNVIFLFLSVLLLQLISVHFRFSLVLALLGNLFFVLSFPLFYYGTIGLIEPGLIFLLLTSLYFSIKGKFIENMLLFLPGILMKETFIIALPVLWIYMYRHQVSVKKAFFLNIGILALITVSMLIARNWSPAGGLYVWSFQPQFFLDNVSRSRTWISGLLALGIPGIISLLGIAWQGRSWLIQHFPLYAGLFLSVLLFFYSIMSAHSDGRFLWLSYPYTIPLALFTIRAWKENAANTHCNNNLS